MSLLCPTCGKLFSSNNSYQRHIKNIHGKNKFFCNLCKIDFMRKQYLQTHIEKIHPLEAKKKKIPTTMCTICKAIIVLRNLKRHLIQKHSPLVNVEGKKSTKICTVCNKMLLCNLKYHMIKKHSPNINEKITSSTTKCTECCKLILVRNLNRHMIKKHSGIVHIKKKRSMTCIVCKELVLSNLKRHMIRKHSPLIDDERQFKCYICTDKKYSSQSSLKRHMNNAHQVYTPLMMKCPLCKHSFVKVPKENPKSIFNHFKSIHRISMVYETLHFKSIDEFYSWKCNIEKETISSFILNLKKSNKLVFKCHRSGKYRSKGCIKRILRVIGSCKINGFCPAAITANIVNNNEIDVTYQQTHVGHKNELRYIALTAEERKVIATQLANNVPYDEILKEIHSSLIISPLQRIHLVNRKDIHNIKRSYILKAEVM